jgi:hypothetical protein
MVNAIDNPTPENLQEWMVAISKEVGRLGRRMSSPAYATTSAQGQPERVPSLPPNFVPSAAPEEAPIVTVEGFDDAMTVVAQGNIAPTTILDYYVDDVLVASTTATVLYATRDGNGDLFEEDQGYTWVVVARNDLGSLASDPVVGFLRPDVDSQTVLGWVAAGFILAGTIQVGQMTWSPPTEDDPGGLKIPLLNGGLIHFPADGTDAIITAVLHARSIVSDDNMEIYGDNNKLFGTMTAQNGITAPSIPPTASTFWDHDDAYETTTWTATHEGETGDFSVIFPAVGLWDNSTEWLFCETTGTYTGKIWAVDKTTGAKTEKLNLAVRPTSIVKVGSTYYISAKTSAGWFIYKYNTSWVWTGALSTYLTGAKEPIVLSNGSDLHFAYMLPSSPNQIRLQRLNESNGDIEAEWVCSTANVGTPADLKGGFLGTADFGATRFVLCTTDRIIVLSVSGVTATIQTAHSWNRANGEALGGIAWDGSVFHTLSQASRKIWNYVPLVTATSRSITWSRYNATSGDETEASPALTWTQPPRHWMRVDTPGPGGTGDPDDPDSVRIYVANKRQPDLGVGVDEGVYGIPGTGGAAAPTSNGFGGTTAPGNYKSADYIPGVSGFEFPGSGLWELAGLSEWTNYTPALTDTTSGAAKTGTVNYARYLKFGDTIHCQGDITLTSTTTGGLSVSMPFAAAVRQHAIGTVRLWGTGLPADQSGAGSMNADKARLNVVALSAGFRDGTSGQSLRWDVVYKLS